MTVAWILKQKGRNVISALPGTTVEHAISLLEKHNIGAVVIVDEHHRVQGIVSERDIVRIMATQGAGVLGEPVDGHMTRNVVVCSEQHSIDWLMEQMTSRRFRHIPVAENGRLAGIVSIGDVVKHKLALAESEAAQMRGYFAAG
ncbi:MAG: CBS domain-containing protein [Rhodomicrobium sp.]